MEKSHLVLSLPHRSYTITSQKLGMQRFWKSDDPKMTAGIGFTIIYPSQQSLWAQKSKKFQED